MPDKTIVYLPYVEMPARGGWCDMTRARMLVYDAMHVDQLDEAAERIKAEQRRACTDLHHLRATFAETGIPCVSARAVPSRVNPFVAAQRVMPNSSTITATSMRGAPTDTIQDDDSVVDVAKANNALVAAVHFETLLGQQLRLRLLRDSQIDLSRSGDVVLHELQRLQCALSAGHRRRRDLNAARCVEQREYKRTRDHLQTDVQRTAAKVRALESALRITASSPLASLASDDNDK